MAVWAAVCGGVAVLAAAAGSRAVGQRWALRGRGDAAPQCGRAANPGSTLKTTCASRIPNSLAESRIEAPLRGAWPPGATDAVRVQGTHLIPLSPGASTAITELQLGGAPEAAPSPPSGHGRAGTTSVPRASAPPDARTAGPAPAPWLVRQRRRAQPTRGRPAVPSRHHRAAGCIGRRISGCLAPRFPGPHRRTWPSPPGRSRRSGAPAVVKRVDRDTARLPATSPGRPRGCPRLKPSGVAPRGAALRRWCVARGGGAARCAGRRCGPGGAARHAASPVRAAPDRRPVGRQPRGVPAH